MEGPQSFRSLPRGPGLDSSVCHHQPHCVRRGGRHPPPLTCGSSVVGAELREWRRGPPNIPIGSIRATLRTSPAKSLCSPVVSREAECARPTIALSSSQTAPGRLVWQSSPPRIAAMLQRCDRGRVDTRTSRTASDAGGLLRRCEDADGRRVLRAAVQQAESAGRESCICRLAGIGASRNASRCSAPIPFWCRF